MSFDDHDPILFKEKISEPAIEIHKFPNSRFTTGCKEILV